MYWLLQYLLSCDKNLTAKRLMIFFAIDYVDTVGQDSMKNSQLAKHEKHKKQSITYYERLLGLPRSTISREIHYLKNLGWIRIEGKPNLETFVHLTGKGKDMLFFANKHVIEHLKVIKSYGKKYE